MNDLINENVLKGKWREIKGEMQKAWGRLTDDDLEKAKGDFNALAGLVQEKYGLGKEAVRDKMNSLIGRFNVRSDQDEENAPSSRDDLM